MSHFQDFDLWMVAGMVRHYQQFLASSQLQHKTMDGFLDILVLSTSQLLGEVLSLMAWPLLDEGTLPLLSTDTV